MWHNIARAIAEATGQAFTIQKKQAITGGDTDASFIISGHSNKITTQYLVKLNDKSHLPHFEAQAYALEQLTLASTPICPKFVTLGISVNKSFIALNYLSLHPGNTDLWYLLGQQLANMHKTSTHGQFGWPHDNYIGTTLQPNAWSSNWRTFFAEQRIGWQLQLLSEKSIFLGDIDHIATVCHDALSHHQVQPTLVHGDLWRGNVAFTGKHPVIFDPASYYGDREVDIAMSELFGPFPRAFYQGYQTSYPLDSGFEQRKAIYNFYHILNHVNIFGGVYIEQAKATLSRLLSFDYS